MSKKNPRPRRAAVPDALSRAKQETPALPAWSAGLVRYLATNWTPSRKRPRSKRFSHLLRQSRRWGWGDNLVGVGWSWKEGAHCLQFLVGQKLHRKRLEKGAMIPTTLEIPGSDAPVPTDVIEVGRNLQLHAGRLFPGIALGHRSGPEGTLSYLVRSTRFPGSVLMLSCSHVLARSGAAPIGDFIEQPFLAFSDPIENRVGRLVFRTSLASNGRDVALAEVLPGISLTGGLFGGPGSIPAIDRIPQNPRNMPVRMFGARSGERAGIVLAGMASVRIGGFTLHGLVPYQVIASEGDSGSPVLATTSGAGIGMHIGGDSNRGVGFFLPVAPIFSEMGLALADGLGG